MLNIMQCLGFGPWSYNYQPAWVEDGYMSYTCDEVETQDLMNFQEFTTLIPVEAKTTQSGLTMQTPDVVATTIPLSTIIIAHHNLVTYGVPFEEWTNPGPEKRYYTPEEGVKLLVNTDLFKDDEEVQTWYANVVLEPPDVKNVPGMAKWVELAKSCFSLPKQQVVCDRFIGKQWWANFLAAHPSAPIM